MKKKVKIVFYCHSCSKKIKTKELGPFEVGKERVVCECGAVYEVISTKNENSTGKRTHPNNIKINSIPFICK